LKQFSYKKPGVLILGIGNDILTDDGIGPRLIKDLKKEKFPGEVTLGEASLGGMELLETVKGYHEVILIDAMKSGQHPPGTVIMLYPEDFDSTLHIPNFHDIDFLTALELGKRSGIQVPSTINIIAIEIIEDRVFSDSFTPGIQKQYPDILDTVRSTVDQILQKSPDCQ
jgi:hydrogenase maturation protease